MSNIEERKYWLAWSQISGVGPILIQRLQQHFSNLETAWKASPGELRKVEGFGIQTLEKVIQQKSRLNPEQLLTQHQQINPHFWTPADPEYPQLLREIPTPPPLLYYRGVIDLQENSGQKPLVGIVGTRQPTEYGIKWTRQISTALAKNGFTVVSGMAEGIDTESHSATLKAGGRTIAVMGTGVDVIYPHKNRDLYQQILKSGIVISEYPAKTPPNRTHFPRRNRIIAGLSRAVLVMEAPLKSGALITATYANEFNRDVYALPGKIDDQPSQGCLKLISQGAGLINHQLNELLIMLGAIPQIDIETETPLVKSPPIPNLAPELQQIINILAIDALSFDFIIQKTGMNAAIVSSSLLQLELMGLVTQLPGMRYQKL
ncbi:DNA-processing protein DprA [Dolichospermum circinale CS-1225]|uniref:DNA-processing protein DprA n=1 Tax=Dolichospermum circinale CS-537/01 TaxID=3021739 RepID=A0ABT5A7C8_9CYAN|nr:DNA-processing protein DprA [Dolichospermum circinale]MDB9458223.1 DNA-processing protein DprA [Dolichospermum circinale CS-545/17]MDB9466780.1 DNA-processing protein DprA [Dolichospermum circinale CS-539/09]MDB9472669.1 DNA-processing protein DprA [Dolichospermum circinale CS-539]MDB9487855.1 DNA-processing protein DprA [Dolichospermum circinale CS-537/01]MDB9521702.1 DNA-processing protein DprA [Dolichospermum circinale CS-1225]